MRSVSSVLGGNNISTFVSVRLFLLLWQQHCDYRSHHIAHGNPVLRRKGK